MTKKKNYEKPELQVLEFKHQQVLYQTSGGLTGNSMPDPFEDDEEI